MCIKCNQKLRISSGGFNKDSLKRANQYESKHLACIKTKFAPIVITNNKGMRGTNQTTHDG